MPKQLPNKEKKICRKTKDNSMNDEEWNAWTTMSELFLMTQLEASREQAETIGMEQEEISMITLNMLRT